MSAKKLARLVIAVVSVTIALNERCTAGDSVTAILRDGRNAKGVIDIRTDADHLWLRRTLNGFDLVSGFAWAEVLAGRIDEHELDASQFQRRAVENKQAGRPFSQVASASSSNLPSASQPSAKRAKAKTLVIQAQLAQWDKDAQSDGLRIAVSPLDAQGQLVPVDGHIEFTLVVEHERIDGGQRFVKGPVFPEGERFSYMVRRQDFAGGAAFYDLAFSKIHPDFDPNIASQALVHARLSVPTVGVFEASDVQVCLRELSRFRDQLQYYTPGRYLPLESTGQPNR